MLGRVVVEGQQFFKVVGDLGGGLRPLGAAQLVEGADGSAGVVLALGVPDLGQGLLRPRVRGLRQTPRARLRSCGTTPGGLTSRRSSVLTQPGLQVFAVNDPKQEPLGIEQVVPDPVVPDPQAAETISLGRIAIFTGSRPWRGSRSRGSTRGRGR